MSLPYNDLAYILEAISGGISSYLKTKNELDQIRQDRAQQQAEFEAERAYRGQQIGLQQQQLRQEQLSDVADRTQRMELAEMESEDAARDRELRLLLAGMEDQLARDLAAEERAAKLHELKLRYGASGVSDDEFERRVTLYEQWDSGYQQNIDQMMSGAESPQHAAGILSMALEDRADVQELVIGGGMSPADAELAVQAQRSEEERALREDEGLRIGEVPAEGPSRSPLMMRLPGMAAEEAMRRTVGRGPLEAGKAVSKAAQAVGKQFLGIGPKERPPQGRLTAPPESKQPASIQYTPSDTLTTEDPYMRALRRLQRRGAYRRNIRESLSEP